MGAITKLINYIADGRVGDWETGMTQFFGNWNEWADSYRMKYTDGDKRPQGISKNVNAETPRATNTLATTITSMQTAGDPPFELRSIDGLSEEQEPRLFNMENRLRDNLTNVQFTRNLAKGNRGMCLFGTQVWEKPYVTLPLGSSNPEFEGTAFRPLSLLQSAFDPSVYDMEFSDFFAQVTSVGEHYLRSLGNTGQVWDKAQIEEALKNDSAGSGDTGFSKSAIESRRARAGYQQLKNKQHELILFHGRMPNDILETPEFKQMWDKYGRTDDPHYSDITVGVLDRRYMVRFHPTPYGTWHHLYNIGHYMEFELEPIAQGVGSLGNGIQKDMNRIMRYASDVAKFSLFNMFLAGRGSGLKSAQMNVFPWSAIPVDDVSQIKELRPQVEGILNGIKLYEIERDDHRGVTNAVDSLQAVITGATASETNLAQGSALRAVGLAAIINGDSVIRPYYQTAIMNMLDQNPYDANLIKVKVSAKLVTDRDYRPEYAKKLLEFANLTTTIRNTMPLDFNVMPILKYFARSVGINPRELTQPKPQADRLLDVMRRLSSGGAGAAGGPGNEVAGEAAGSGLPDGNVSPMPQQVPTSPLQGMR